MMHLNPLKAIPAKKRTIKNSTGIFAFAIILQITTVLGTFAIHYFQEDARKELEIIQAVEQALCKALSLENGANAPADEKEDQVMVQYAKIKQLMYSPRVHMAAYLVSQREGIFTRMTGLREQRDAIHTRIQAMLPNLAGSIQYIHAHHIAYLKNILTATPLNPDGRIMPGYFGRKNDTPAPEIYIIEAVLQIHADMQMIYDTFSKLKSGLSPAGISAEFNARIQAFYNSVNRFEDYSLDAQDGILTEELLINGRTFESSFKQFLDIETRLMALEKQFEANRNTFLDHVEHEKQLKILAHTDMYKLMNGLQMLSLSTSLFMLFLLFFFGWAFISGFRRTLQETRRIREDINYRIPVSEADFTELSGIFNALNSMSDTIQAQVTELQAAKTDLEQRVMRRTRELQGVNEQLKKEIEERIAGEQARMDLEKRLFQSGKMESLGNLAGGIAHDFNNILTGIMAYAQLGQMQINKDPDRAKKQIEMVEKGTRRAADLVGRILTFTRRDDQKKIQLNLSELVAEALKLIRSTIPSYIRVNEEIESQACVFGDPTRLHQVLMNLCTNAAHAMNKNGGTLSVRLSETSITEQDTTVLRSLPPGRYASLEIKDTGTGIPKADLEHIFEPYFTTKKPGDGTGLGLAIVYSIIQDHNGHISVDSVRGEGSVFSILIPCTRTQAQLSETPPADTGIPATGSGHLMVVDDEANIRNAFRDMLEDCGYQVSIFKNGAEALAAFEAVPHGYDLIITDLTMPEMSGDDLIRHILGKRPTLPIILCSGFREKTGKARAYMHDNCCFLQKPVDTRNLTAKIHEMIDRAQAGSPAPGG
ncbi:MAG: response regulator [Desulfobacter sp.]|nr:MAG: response regulator [Desulfobacter sp.]